MKKIIIIAAILLCAGLASASKFRPLFDAGRATRGIIWILKDQGAQKYDYRFTWAGEIGRIIGIQSKEKGVDIDAMVTTAYTESSFHMDAVGEKGEMGMFQLYGSYLKRMLKRRDQYEANVEIGAERLALAIRVCTQDGQKETAWEEVFGHYRSGGCNPEYGKWKAKLLRRLKKALDNGSKRTENN